MSTLLTSGEFHEGIHLGMLKLRNEFMKSLCFICGPCEKCEVNFLRNDQESGKVRVCPGLKVRKNPGLRKRTKIQSMKRRNLSC